jgi:hypothetical protein
VADRPDSTLAEIQAGLAKERVHRLKLRYKKSLRASEQNRPDVVAARKALQKAQPKLDQKRLVFIDETRANTKMTRLYGRALQGQRLDD